MSASTGCTFGFSETKVMVPPSTGLPSRVTLPSTGAPPLPAPQPIRARPRTDRNRADRAGFLMRERIIAIIPRSPENQKEKGRSRLASPVAVRCVECWLIVGVGVAVVGVNQVLQDEIGLVGREIGPDVGGVGLHGVGDGMHRPVGEQEVTAVGVQAIERQALVGAAPA